MEAETEKLVALLPTSVDCDGAGGTAVFVFLRPVELLHGPLPQHPRDGQPGQRGRAQQGRGGHRAEHGSKVISNVDGECGSKVAPSSDQNCQYRRQLVAKFVNGGAM